MKMDRFDFKTIKKERIDEIVLRLHNEMYMNYYGGDSILINNHVETNEHGIPIVNYIFTLKELEFIENENILNIIRKEGWKITITKESKINVKFLFEPIKK